MRSSASQSAEAGEHAEEEVGVVSQLWAWGRPYLPHYAAGLVLLLLTNGLSLWIPWLLRDAVRAMEQGAELRVVRGFALGMVAVAVAQAVVRTLSRLTLLGASRRIVYDVRNAFFDRLQQFGPSFYDSQRTGDIMSRGVNDTGLIQGLYGPGLLNLLNTTIVYAAVLALLLRIDVVLTLIALALYPPLFFGVNRVSRRVYARSLAVQERLADLSNRAQESISGNQQVKIYAQEEPEIEQFRRLGEDYRRLNLSLAVLRGGMLSLIGIVSGLATLVVLFVGGRFVVEGRMDFGDFVAFNAYLALLVWPTIALGWIINTLQRGAAATRRIGQLLVRAPDMPAVGLAREPNGEAAPLCGDIEIRGLSFCYPARARPEDLRPALHDIRLSIPWGSRVALVGPVGSGKSTLANVLAGFYPPPPGTLFIGGEDVAAVPLSRLRQAIGYVPQEAFLFSRTVRENIALGWPEATEEQLERAVDLAHLRGDIASFPLGLDTRVGERGVTLSGGQRQRTTLARALVGERRIVILDDSLSGVDADTEQAILDALRERDRDRTLILITHRLSTLADMDRIVVLADGRVVEQGTHAELLAEDGLYATLARRHRLEQRLSG